MSARCCTTIRSSPTDAIEFHGQVVFAVVARDARRGAPRRAGSPRSRPRPARRASRSTMRSRPTADILPDYDVPARTTAPPRSPRAPHRVKGALRIGGQEHFYLEGQVSLAIPGEDGDMLVHSSTQHPSEMQHLRRRHARTCRTTRSRSSAPHGRRVSAARRRQAAQWAAIAALGARMTGQAVQDPARPRRRHDASPASGTISSSTTRSASTTKGRIQALRRP